VVETNRTVLSPALSCTVNVLDAQVSQVPVLA